MKLVALTLFGVVGLSGCGTLPSGATSATDTSANAGPLESRIDHARMSLIDHVAARRGVQVVWINPPRRNVAAGS